MNFSLIRVIEYSKKKDYRNSENWKFKIWQKILTYSLFFLINALLFVCIEQKSKTEVR